MQQEDSHTCKRCMMQIVGLDNYVTHRQQNCLNKTTYHTSQPSACEPPNDIGYNTCNNDIDLQNASDFFSSLELKCNISESYNASTKKLSTDLFPMTFEYDSDNYAETENGYYPPQSHTGGKWEPGTRPDLTNEQWLRSPSPTRKDYECTLCKKIYQDKASLEKHLNSLVHQIVKVPEQDTVNQTEDEDYVACKFPCKTCQLGFDNETKYLSHLLAEDHKEKCSNLTSWHKLVLKQQTKANRFLPYHCAICQFYFSQNNDLVNHLNEKYHLEKLFELRRNLYCLNCKFEAFRNEDLIKHIASDSHSNTIKNADEYHPVMIIEKSLRFACKYCLGYCKLLSESETGAKSCKEAVLYNCPHCEYKSKSSSLLRCHICKEHPGNGRRNKVIQSVIDKSKELKTIDLVCSICKETAKNASELRRHIISKHTEQSVNCVTCNRLFMSENDFHKHCESKMHKMRSEEKATNDKINLELEPEKPGQLFQCHKCHFESKSRGLMCLHCAQHDGPIPDFRYDENGLKITGNVYQCPFCSKEFRFSVLECHIYTHTGEKPFKCSSCNKRFSQRTTQKAHEITHTNNNYIYNCQVCSFQTKRKAIYNMHIKTHHDQKILRYQQECSNPIKIQTTITKPRVELKFLCEICGFSARSKSYLSSHVRIHTGEKPFSCKTCSYTCAHYSNLVRHTNSAHTGDKPFKCPYCVYCCNTREGIRTHIVRTKRHHNFALFPCSYPTCKYNTNNFRKFEEHVLEDHLDIQYEEESTSEILTFLYAHRDLLKIVSKPSKLVSALNMEKPNNPTISTVTKVSRVSNQHNPTISTSVPQVLSQRVDASTPIQNGIVLVQSPFLYTTVTPSFVSIPQPRLFVVQNNVQIQPRILPTITRSVSVNNILPTKQIIQPVLQKLVTIRPKTIESSPQSFLAQVNNKPNTNQFFYTFNGKTVIPKIQETPQINVALGPTKVEMVDLTETKDGENIPSLAAPSNSTILLQNNSTVPKNQTIIIRKIIGKVSEPKKSIQILLKPIPREINNVKKN